MQVQVQVQAQVPLAAAGAITVTASLFDLPFSLTFTLHSCIAPS